MPQAQQGFRITDSTQLEDGVVTSAKIALDTILAADVAPNAIGDSEIAAHTTTKITVPFSLVTGTVPIAQGGSGAATALAAFNALSPLTTTGDLLTRDATNNLRLAIGAALAVLRVNAGGTALEYATLAVSKRVASFTTDVAIANSAAETDLINFTLTGGDMGANDVLYIRIPIDNFNSTGADGLTWRVRFGATNIESSNMATNITTVTNGYIEVYIFAAGATNSQDIIARVHCEQERGTNAEGENAYNELFKGTAAIDTTANVTVRVTAQWGVAAAGRTITALAGFAMLIKS